MAQSMARAGAADRQTPAGVQDRGGSDAKLWHEGGMGHGGAGRSRTCALKVVGLPRQGLCCIETV